MPAHEARRAVGPGRRARADRARAQHRLQVLGKIFGGGIATPGLGGQRLHHHQVEIAAGRVVQALEGFRLLAPDDIQRLEQAGRRQARMRQPAGQQLVSHRAQCIHIAARIGAARVAFELLRAHVGQGAHHLADLGHVAADLAEHAGDAEVEDLGLPVLVHQNVGRLEVAVHDAALVGEVHRLRQLRQQADARAQVGLLALQVATQVRTAHDFKREPGRRQATDDVLARRVQADDARMLQLPEDRDLATEALQRAAGQAAHDLQRDVARWMRFAGQVDPAHAALSQQAEDAVRTDGIRQAGIGLRLFV